MITNIPYYNEFINSFSTNIFEKFSTIDSAGFYNALSYTNVSLSSIFDDALSSYLTKLDDVFASSQYRINNFKIKQKRKRTLITSTGEISFVRRQYYCPKKMKYFYYIDDDILSIAPYQRFSADLIQAIYTDVTVDSYQRIADRYKISKNSVYSYICKLANHEIILENRYNEAKKQPILYVQADECYVAKQKDKSSDTKKYILKQVVVHEGLKPVCKGRNALMNKTLFAQHFEESNTAFYQRIQDWILANYAYDNLYFYGDGASWIKSCASEINGDFILDLFHTRQALNRVVGNGKETIKEILLGYLYSGKKAEFKQVVDELVTGSVLNQSKLHIRSYAYLLKEWNNIRKNFKFKDSVGCSQEGINSHYFARRLTTTPRGFSVRNAMSIGTLIAAKVSALGFETAIKNISMNINNTNDEYKELKKGYLPKQGKVPLKYYGIKGKSISKIVQN